MSFHCVLLMRKMIYSPFRERIERVIDRNWQAIQLGKAASIYSIFAITCNYDAHLVIACSVRSGVCMCDASTNLVLQCLSDLYCPF